MNPGHILKTVLEAILIQSELIWLEADQAGILTSPLKKAGLTAAFSHHYFTPQWEREQFKLKSAAWET